MHVGRAENHDMRARRSGRVAAKDYGGKGQRDNTASKCDSQESCAAHFFHDVNRSSLDSFAENGSNACFALRGVGNRFIRCPARRAQ